MKIQLMKSIEDLIITIVIYMLRLGIEKDHQSETQSLLHKAIGLHLRDNQLDGISMEMIKIENKHSWQLIMISQLMQHQVLLIKILGIGLEELIIKKLDN